MRASRDDIDGMERIPQLGMSKYKFYISSFIRTKLISDPNRPELSAW
jgi:hypothetical protein